MVRERSKKRTSRWVIATVLLLVLGFCAVFVALMSRARSSTPSEISEATRETWGTFLLEIYAPRRESPTAPCVVQLQTIADSLTAMIPAEPVLVSVALDSTVNAVSLPGRRVVFFQGLLAEVESENELTMILAHEIGHHEADHIVEAFARRMFLNFAALGAGQWPVVGPILVQLGNLGDLSFSRDAESEADAMALDMLQRYYGHVAGSTDFFERRLEEGEWSGVAEFLNTHPLSRKRVDAIEVLARNEGWTSGDLAPPPEPCED